jgi:hypothetical protein
MRRRRHITQINDVADGAGTGAGDVDRGGGTVRFEGHGRSRCSRTGSHADGGVFTTICPVRLELTTEIQARRSKR